MQLNSETIKTLATAFKNQFTTLKVKIKFADFNKFLEDNFKDVADCLIVAMFERFKPFRLDGVRENINVVNENQMDVLDFIISMNLLARIVYDKKLKLLFELCDDDDDGCMTPEDILSML
jgi:Ca2+-binding EF-hand superfamily protein